jgi:hypothetical protein
MTQITNFKNYLDLTLIYFPYYFYFFTILSLDIEPYASLLVKFSFMWVYLNCISLIAG